MSLAKLQNLIDKPELTAEEKLLESFLMQAEALDTKKSLNELVDIIRVVLEKVEITREELAKEILDERNRTIDKLNGLAHDLATIEDSLEKKIETSESYSKNELDKLAVNIFEKISEVKNSIPSPTDLSGLEKAIEAVEKKIPNNEKLKTEIMAEITELHEGLMEGFKKEIEAIKKVAVSGKGGTRRVFQPHVDDFSGDTDGSTKTFYLSRAPLKTETVTVFGTDFPVILRPTIDFTVSGTTLTLTSEVSAPTTGATLIASYYA